MQHSSIFHSDERGERKGQGKCTVVARTAGEGVSLEYQAAAAAQEQQERGMQIRSANTIKQINNDRDKGAARCAARALPPVGRDGGTDRSQPQPGA